MSSIIKRQNVDVETRGSPRRSTPQNADACNAKHVRLIEVGTVVRAIEFTCSCGERSVIELELDKDSSSTPRPG